MTITESLKRFRGEYKLTQKNVSDVLGMSQQSYYYYESKGDPPSAAIVKLAKTYHVSADYLLGLSDEPNHDSAPVAAAASTLDDEFTKAAFAIAEAMRGAINQRLQERAEVVQ